MPSGLENPNLTNMAEPLTEFTSHMDGAFPQLEWDLKRAGYSLTTPEYLAVSIYVSIVVFVGSVLIVIFPFFLTGQETNFMALFSGCLGLSILSLIYLIVLPKMKIKRRSRQIDKDLEYVLKDMYIQLTSGVPLFDTFVNIAQGDYGECSQISEDIIREVESGKSMTEVLDDVGMWSPSEHFREALWQIVNSLRSGSDVTNALESISRSIRLEKQNKIRAYAEELNLWGLIYMMAAVVVPSMGVTLLVILSSFIGQGIINEKLFWVILGSLIVFQAMFISFIRAKRPII